MMYSLENLELYLEHIGFSTDFFFTKQDKEQIQFPSIEFISNPIAKNDNLSFNLTTTLNGLITLLENDTITFNSLYAEYTTIATLLPNTYVPYAFTEFVNGLTLFELVFSIFNHDLLKIDLQIINEEELSIYYMDNSDTIIFQAYHELLKKLNANEKNRKSQLLLNNFLFLFFIFSIGGKAGYGKINSDYFYQNIDAYCNFYISNVAYGLMIHLEMIAYCNLYKEIFGGAKEEYYKKSKDRIYGIGIGIGSNSNKDINSYIKEDKEKKFNKNFNHNSSSRRGSRGNVPIITNTNSNINNKNSNNILLITPDYIINFCLFDNITIAYSYNEVMKIMTILNDLKCFLLGSITNYYQFKISLTICNPDTLKRTNFFRNFKGIYPSKSIQISALNIFYKDNQSNLLKQWSIEQLIIKVKGFTSPTQITNYFDIYKSFISKAKDFHMRSTTNESDVYITIESLILEWGILESVLKILYYTKDSNKNSTISYALMFNTWKLTLNRSTMPNVINSNSKNITVYFNYSNLQEKILSTFLSNKLNLLMIIKTLLNLMTLLEPFKGYNVGVRLFQNNFRSNQMDLYITLITHAVVNQVIDKKLEASFTIFERKFSNFIESMHCYIGDAKTEKESTRIKRLRSAFKKVKHNKYLELYSLYLDELLKRYELIVFSETMSSLRIIRGYEDNYLFAILNKNPKPTKTAIINTLISTIQPNEPDKEPEDDFRYYSLQLFSYLTNKKESYADILKIHHTLKYDRNQKCRLEMTLIVEKNYFDNSILEEQTFKKYYENIVKDTSNYYIISQIPGPTIDGNGRPIINTKVSFNHRGPQEYFDYDLHITLKSVRIFSYTKYDHITDPTDQKFIYNFIGIISDCYEMIVTLYRQKGKYPSRLIYVFKTIDDETYVFDFKGGNLFIKKLPKFNNLILINLNDAIPVLCIISMREVSDYTSINDNIFDTFYKFLLNLHKVTESKNDLNRDVFKKIHRNIFEGFYDQFCLVAFSYSAFQMFNEIFLRNDYMSFTKGEMFDRMYIIPFDSFGCYKSIYQRMIVKNVIVFGSDLGMIHKESKQNFKYFSFTKVEALIKDLREFLKGRVHDRSKILCYLKMKLNYAHNGNVNEEIRNDIAKKIMGFYCMKNVKEFYIEKDLIEGKIDEYMKEKVKLENEKLGIRYSKLTEGIYGKENKYKQGCYLI